jgi:hypothetical protein
MADTWPRLCISSQVSSLGKCHPGDFFGDSVSVSHDTPLIGAPAGMGSNVEAGAAYVFGRNGNGSWSEQQKLRSTSPSLLGAFGRALAVSNDTAVISATGEPRTLTSPNQPGSAYVFGRSNGNWIPQQAFPAGAAPVARIAPSNTKVKKH